MALLDDILKWTEQNLPLWQRDAARRLFQKEDGLSDEDYEEIYELMKVEHGLPNPKQIKAEPLRAAHIPVTLKEGEEVILNSICNLINVNCIAPDAKLSFGQSGMTIIYGGNGSGKSGYTRVMKRACRSRDQIEEVHPDASDPNANNYVPEALFYIEGLERPVKWITSNDPPDELATISVFDAHCARAYITSEQDVAYLPYGLDILENLANKVIPEIKRKLVKEKSEINVDKRPFEHLLGETEVGKTISGLSYKTDLKIIEKLGRLSDKELERLGELEGLLGEKDPKAKVRECRLSASRLKDLAKRIEGLQAYVNDKAIEKYKELSASLKTAIEAESKASEMLQSGETLLPGTGGDLWKVLFEAARKFSNEEACPERKFPMNSEETLCPLCQQKLGKANDRIQRFEKYIQDDVSKTVAEKRRQNLNEINSLEKLNLRLELDDSIVEELDGLDSQLAGLINEFGEYLESRKCWIVNALKTSNWNEVSLLKESPRAKLRKLAAFKIKEARSYEKAGEINKRKTLVKEKDELAARKNLSVCLEAVLELVNKMRKKQALESCEANFNTRRISDKSREFGSIYITQALKNALDDEFKELGVGHIKTRLTERNEKGRVKTKLSLDLPTTRKINEILSEGEQRAIAIGAFLAELKLAKHSGAIVFDDPVTSLEHNWRGKVAERLVSESMKRQVIIFTHEVVFLHQLMDECDKEDVELRICFLEKIGKNSGNVKDGLPWDQKDYKERIDELEKKQREFERLPWPPVPHEELAREMIRQYSFLRATVERVVEKVILNSTIRRFNDYVDVKKLEEVLAVEEHDVKEVIRIWSECHSLIEAHDSSLSKNDPPPTPSDLKQHIEELKNIIQRIKDKRKKKTN